MNTHSTPGRCPSCGLVGAPHASDLECILALRQQIANANGFVVAGARTIRLTPGKEHQPIGSTADGADPRPRESAQGF